MNNDILTMTEGEAKEALVELKNAQKNLETQLKSCKDKDLDVVSNALTIANERIIALKRHIASFGSEREM